MADTYAAKPEGFKGFYPRRPIGIHDSISPLTRAKLTSSTFDIWKGVPVINATGGTFDRVAVQGTDEIQRITITGTPTGGSFTLTSTITGTRTQSGSLFTGTTVAIAYNATAATVQTALETILGVGNVSCAGGPLPGSVVNITFTGQLSATNVAALSTTDSLTGGSSPASAISTPTSGVIGIVTTATGVIGFSEEWDSGTTPNWPRSFVQAPLNLEGPFATTTKQYLIFPDTAGNIYTGAIWPTETVAATMVNTAYSLGWNNTTAQVYIRTGDTSNAVVKVVGIPDGQVGKVGGLVDFIVVDGVSIFH